MGLEGISGLTVVLVSVYAAVTLGAMLLTLAEGRTGSGHPASALGTALGCVACLFWLPLMVAMLLAARFQPAPRPGNAIPAE